MCACARTEDETGQLLARSFFWLFSRVFSDVSSSISFNISASLSSSESTAAFSTSSSVSLSSSPLPSTCSSVCSCGDSSGKLSFILSDFSNLECWKQLRDWLTFGVAWETRKNNLEVFFPPLNWNWFILRQQNKPSSPTLNANIALN